jgi:Mn2+/Fe2+ NRAMP family transporter
MMVATGALFSQGKGIVRILDMADTLEPVAGRFAVALFMAGTLAAGLSSVFPIMMVGPLLLGDMKAGRMDTKSPMFRGFCLIAALWGLVVPALGSNPVMVTIAAQVSNVFVLPLTVFVIIWLLNRRDIMGVHRAGVMLNVLLTLALAFSLAVAYAGAKSLVAMFFG